MSIVTKINTLLAKVNLCLVDRSVLYDWQVGRVTDRDNIPPLPAEAKAYLQVNNPRLQELRTRYAHYQEAVSTAMVWTDEYVRSNALQWFRGDNCYVWQTRDPNCDEINYCLTACYVQLVDRLGILERTHEDGLFGAHTCRLGTRLFSRDLMDSVLELNFLEEHLQINEWQGMRILDIGAGYGRLAHRAVESLPGLEKYFCADAVPESTFLSEYHLSYRCLQDRAVVIPLDEITKRLPSEQIDLAVNIHSFSECTLEAIDWWLSLLADNRVRYLFIVPNPSDHGGERLALNGGEDFSHVVERYGYALLVKRAKYKEPLVRKYGVSPTWYYLYELC